MFKSVPETYRTFTLAMVMGAMYPNPANQKKRIIYLGAVTASVLPVYVMWFYDVAQCIQNLDLDNLTRQLSLGVPIMFCQFKMILVTLLRKELKIIIDEINSDYERYNHLDEDYQTIAEDNRSSLLRLERTWSSMVCVTVSMFPLMAVVMMMYHHLLKEPKRFMVHDIDVPWLGQARYESPYFEILFAYMLYIAFILTLCYMSYDGMFFVCIFHTCLKLRMIGCTLSKAFKDCNDIEGIKKTIAMVVEDQCGTFRFIDRITFEYEAWLVLVFGLTIIQICMNMYQILTSSASDVDPRYVIFIVAAILHIYVPCFLVSKLSATAAEVADTAYCSGWEMVADSSVRRCIHIILMRAQKPVTIQALNMITFNMELFVSVMQTSYSVFTLLRS